MRNFVTLLIVCSVLTVGLYTTAFGAPLAVTPATTPPIVEGTALVDNDPLFGFDFSAFETPAFSLTSDPAGATNLFIDAVLTGGGGFTSGSLAVSTMSGVDFLSGTLSDVGFVFDPIGDDTLELLFSVQSGTQSSTFGPLVLATFSGDLDTGGNLDFFTDGVFFAETNFKITGVEVESPQIPLPTTLSLLLFALASLAFSMVRLRDI